jgi:SAM-dependent methyltransferase
VPSLREHILRGLLRIGVYPHIGFTYSPFKILEFQALTSAIDWRGDERVLDIGCGAGLQTMLLARHAGHTTGIDIESAFIATARRDAGFARLRGRVDFEDRHLHAIAFPESTFDHIFSICVLEHIPEHEAILSECRRILKPGGQIHFSVDSLEGLTDPGLVESHRRQHHVVQYYRESTLKHLLVGQGYTDVSVRPLFRSELARRLFVEGIERGFNFGRVRATRLASALRRAEAAQGDDGPGLFLLARATKK